MLLRSRAGPERSSEKLATAPEASTAPEDFAMGISPSLHVGSPPAPQNEQCNPFVGVNFCRITNSVNCSDREKNARYVALNKSLCSPQHLWGDKWKWGEVSKSNIVQRYHTKG